MSSLSGGLITSVVIEAMAGASGGRDCRDRSGGKVGPVVFGRLALRGGLQLAVYGRISFREGSIKYREGGSMGSGRRGVKKGEERLKRDGKGGMKRGSIGRGEITKFRFRLI